MTDLSKMSQADLIALVAKMQADAAKPAKRITLKVAEKGGLSMYGLGRFPVTLYRSQWEKLIGEVDAVKAFIEANAAILTTKE